MPLVGAGTWQYNATQAYQSLCLAFQAGYSYIDTANVYGNQNGVGQAIKDCWIGKGRRREDLFVVTKCNGGLGTDAVVACHKQNLQMLGLSYVDNLLVHFPCDWNETPATCNPQTRQAEWRGMEELYNTGLTRSIGISHYCQRHIEDILAIATVKPCINQVEWHVGSGDVDDVIEFCHKNGIFFQSYSPLCGPCTYDPNTNLINGTLVTEVASRYNVTGSQVALKYLVQIAENNYGYGGVIPKSSSATHLAENIDLFSFTLSDADMQLLDSATEPAGTLGDCDAP